MITPTTPSMRQLSGILLMAALLQTAAGDTTNLTPVADTYLFEQNPNNNTGNNDFLVAGVNGFGSRSRSLIKFDLGSAIPTNAVVQSATLSLNVLFSIDFGSRAFQLHRMIKDWAEGNKSGGGDGGGTHGAPATVGESTWNQRLQGVAAWGTPGGQAGTDFAAAASASQSMGSFVKADFASPDLTADVQQWVSNPQTNFGWILILADETRASTARQIGSREDAVNAPILTVTFTTPTPPPVLSPPSVSNNTVSFTFLAQANTSYSVEFRGDAATGTFTTLTNIPAPPTNRTVIISDPLTPSNRFYRARID